MNRIGASCSDFIWTCFQACGCSEEEPSKPSLTAPPVQTRAPQTDPEDSQRQSISSAMVSVSQPIVDATVIKV